MKKLLLWAVVLTTGLTAQAQVWWTSNPGSVTSGSGYSISAEASGGSVVTELYIYKNGSFFAYGSGYGWASAGDTTTDYGVQTVNYWADAYFDDWSWSASAYHSVTVTQPNNAPTIAWVQNPAKVVPNQWFAIQARGNDADGNLTQVFVWREWVPHAFNGGGNGFENYSDANGYGQSYAGTVTFMAQATDSTGATSPVIFHSVSVNTGPTVSWFANLASAWINENFTVRAQSHDNDGNLAWTYVWKDDQPFAFNGGGNGVDSYTDANVTSKNTTGTITFKALAGDAVGDQSGFIWHTVTINNRAPTSPTISSGGVTQINLGQSVTITGTLHDPDGNLVYHNLYYWNGSAWIGLLSGTPSHSTSSSLSTGYTPNSLGPWQFHTNGHDNYAWGPGATLSVSVVDGTAPSVPSGLSSTSVATTSFTLNWGTASDNVGVTAYEVMRDNTSIGTTGSLSLPVTGLAQAATYAMKVRARDAAGNWSVWSNPLSVTTPDTAPPSVPTGLVASAITSTGFTLTWTASTDNGVVTAYEARRDAAALTPHLTGTSMSITGLTPGLTYAMTVRARDAAGNWSAPSAALSVTTALDPAADADNDGVPNGIETQLGTNPSVAKQNDATNAANLKIIKPN